MTYCAALRLKQGLVLVSDSRTNAGVDHIASFKKLYSFEFPGERAIFIQSAGNLATTQSVISILEQSKGSAGRSIYTANSLFEVAEIVGETVRQVIARDEGHNQGIDFGCNLLVSGQIGKEPVRLFHVYPQGNFIEASEQTPYFQIGESKYGKPILDRVVSYDMSLERALQCALISMDSTLRSNLSVGLPVDAVVYHRDQLKISAEYCIDEQHEAFRALRSDWAEGLSALFESLPLHF